MKWTEEAEKALSRVPFFVRRRVRKRVEEYASALDARQVTIDHMDACRKQFLAGMEKEIAGYRVETCFGSDGCPNRILDGDDLASRLEAILSDADLKTFLKERVEGDLKFHHEFKVALAECPNACSRPQIADMGLIATVEPTVTDEPCTLCGSCVHECPDDALTLDDTLGKPIVDRNACLACGRCVAVCPTGTLGRGNEGYRIQLGGKLGRRPRLGSELPGLHTADEVEEALRACVDLYKTHCRRGERFGEIIERLGEEFICDEILPNLRRRRDKHPKKTSNRSPG